MQPDLVGFRAAHIRLNEMFGAMAAFSIPAASGAVTWPTDTGIDPETGFPFDPVIEAEDDSGDPTIVEVRVEVVHRTTSQTGRDDRSVFAAMGWLESSDLALVMLPEAHAQVALATEVVIFGERQRIISFRPDGIQPDQVDRWVAFIEGM